MKKFTILCLIIIGYLTSEAQIIIDNFNVGPYVVDYTGQGNVKYRLMDDIDLYEFFELQRDTVYVVADSTACQPIVPVKHALQIAGNVGANRYAAKEIGLSCVWKQNIATNIYFNGGLSFTFGHSEIASATKRNMIEIGLPLQIELGNLNHHRASLFGSVGVIPTYYSTMNAKIWNGVAYINADKDRKKSGLLVAPNLEFGGNIPVGNVIMRIGVYGSYKINCSSSSYDVYKQEAGRAFLGAKIGLVI